MYSRFLQTGRNLAINAVSVRIEPNKRRGFTYLTFEMEAYCGVPIPSELTACVPTGTRLIDQPQIDYWEQLLAYDTSVHIFERKQFLKQWVNPEVTTCVAAMRGDDMVGYGCIQPMKVGGHHLGPVLAEEPEVGEAILTHLAKSIPEGEHLGLDIPTLNEISRKFVKRHKFQCDLRFTRMMNKASFDVSMSNVFAITTLGVSLL